MYNVYNMFNMLIRQAVTKRYVETLRYIDGTNMNHIHMKKHDQKHRTEENKKKNTIGNYYKKEFKMFYLEKNGRNAAL